MAHNNWQFWIDRGGTFTDVIARDPQGKLSTLKLLSDNPQIYQDAAVHAIRRLLPPEQANALASAAIKMGTTVATNALLERQGEPTVLLITKGFADALRIGYQNRPDLFKLKISLPCLLYDKVIEVQERLSASGQTLIPFDKPDLVKQLNQAHQQGFRSCAIVFMHGYRYHQHEQLAASLAKAAGFDQISVSHLVSPLIKLIGRGDTTVVDSYLTPILQRYINRLTSALEADHNASSAAKLNRGQVQFMQSSGGLVQADCFSGKDAVLSGPAGGVVAMVETAKQAGFERIIGFDMGGTSTDVSVFSGEFERTFDSEVAGVRIQAPMIKIHTVAAGGGSILTHHGLGSGLRLAVGPESAGAYPGPACYRNNGPLTVTDLNLLLGKLQSEHFPAIFGNHQQQSLDKAVVDMAFARLTRQLNEPQPAASVQLSVEQLAQGYLQIAIAHMANAIKHITVQRGIDASLYTLSCFGGAGAQHACLVADALGIKQVFIHRFSSVLSAYGMGLAQVRVIKRQSFEAPPSNIEPLRASVASLSKRVTDELHDQGFAADKISQLLTVQVKYQGTDTSLAVVITADMLNQPDWLQAHIHQKFTEQHSKLYGFSDDSGVLIIAEVQIEGIGQCDKHDDCQQQNAPTSPPVARSVTGVTSRAVYFCDAWLDTPFYRREQLSVGVSLSGPCIVIEQQTTIVVEPDWQLTVSGDQNLLLERCPAAPVLATNLASADPDPAIARQHKSDLSTAVNPVQLELFNNLFMFIAEQMGIVLKNTALSVNIKERLDFSCALFNHQGELVANAPHIPVHLGSMGESVVSIARQNGDKMQAGDVYLLNSPYLGGSHLPDLTVVTPVFSSAGDTIAFYLACRGHHADIGGISPGSMPPHSQHIEQEGIVFDNFLLVRGGVFNDAALVEKLSTHRYPARNISQNIADLKAQIAANQKGIIELNKVASSYGYPVITAYMQHVIDAAQYAVKQVIGELISGSFVYPLDDGCQIKVSVTINRAEQSAIVDFDGTSAQQNSNFNAPLSVCKAAVLYVFRTLVAKDIPLNAGCLKPVTILVPKGCMLNPVYPAAVVAGNVETSQVITDALYGALGISAASQGTMNNFTFGNAQYQYYETLCGGTGASKYGHGVDAVHSHMTNSRLTDPEVLEWRYPVCLVSFAIRQHSGGNSNLYRGGNGVIRKIRFLQPMSGSILSNHRKVPPFGLFGGEAGSTGKNYVITHKGECVALNACDEYALDAGDTFVIETPGGGGFGAATNNNKPAK